MKVWRLKIRECRGITPGGSRVYGPLKTVSVYRPAWDDMPVLGRISIGIRTYTVSAIYSIDTQVETAIESGAMSAQEAHSYYRTRYTYKSRY